VLSETALKLPKDDKKAWWVRPSPDGRRVAYWGPGWCRVAETATGKVLLEFAASERQPVIAAFHPAGKVSFLDRPDTTGFGDRLIEYDLTRRERIRSRALPYGDLCWSPDGRLLLHATEWKVALLEGASVRARWSRSQQRPVVGFSTRRMSLLVALDRTGRRAIAVNEWEALALDTLTGRPLVRIGFRKEMSGRHAAISACGRWLAAPSNHERTIYLYDLDGIDPTNPVLERSFPGAKIRGVALDSGGSRLITAHADGTCVVWDRKRLVSRGGQKKPGAWELLARLDPEVAQPALVTLIQDGTAALKLLNEKLKPAVAVPPARIAGWIAQLDDEDFAKREAAQRSLAAAKDQAEPALGREVRKPKSLETARRAERLLKGVDAANDPDLVRQTRSVEVLERIGSKEAIALLEKLARGAPAALLTREAKEALMRLGK
jgi:hypothetical protein